VDIPAIRNSIISWKKFSRKDLVALFEKLEMACSQSFSNLSVDFNVPFVWMGYSGTKKEEEIKDEYFFSSNFHDILHIHVFIEFEQHNRVGETKDEA